MTPLWLPGVDRVEGNSGGSLVGGDPRWTWHTTEGENISSAIAAYREHNSWPTVTWDPTTGRIVQHLPGNVAARSLENPAGGVETNRQGRVHVQVEVVGYAAHPFTSLRDLPGFDKLAAWWRAQGVPDGWPAGGPLPYPKSYGLDNGQRSAALWVSHGGHYGHSQVPENHHGDPGAVDTSRWAPHGVAVQHPAVHQPTAPTWPFGPGHYLGTPRRDPRCHSGVLGGRDATAVKTWQARMRARGWLNSRGRPLAADGMFGFESARVAQLFGRQVRGTQVGIVDAHLWAAAWSAPVR